MAATAASPTSTELEIGGQPCVLIQPAVVVQQTQSPCGIIVVCCATGTENDGVQAFCQRLALGGYLVLQLNDVAVLSVAAAHLHSTCRAVAAILLDTGLELISKATMLLQAVIVLTTAEFSAAGSAMDAQVPLLCIIASGLHRTLKALREQSSNSAAATRQIMLSSAHARASEMAQDAAAVQECLSWLATHLHGNSGQWEISRMSSAALAETDWWISSLQDKSSSRQFRSLGLEQWEKGRVLWRKSQPHALRWRVTPLPLDNTPHLYDAVVNGILNAHAGAVLPGRISLSDIVHVLNDIWEVEDE